MHHVHLSKSPAILFKIDFTKAFDTLDWGFLMNVLSSRGFPEKFIRWIFHLLATSSSTISVNGVHSAPFKHRRGLRQGDPLSPYLFILAADVLQKMTATLSSLIPQTLTPKLTRPVLIFQYADDTIFLLSSKGPTIRSLLLVLHCFSASSGLQINFAKSAFVPFSIPDDHLQRIQTLLGCCPQELPLTYLGMPFTLRPPRREDFMPLLQKLERRLEGWRARFISRGGRLQLIKSVLSAVPTYFMSCFRLPKWLLDRIDMIRRNFLWSKPQLAAAIHLLNWRTVCLPIAYGGLGVPNLHLQNLSLLLRWWWILYAPENKLWKTYATLLHASPTPRPGPLILKRSGSFFWNSISTLRQLFHSCSKFVPVSGDHISFWFDRWDDSPPILDNTGHVRHRTISLSQARDCLADLFVAPLTYRQHLAIQTLNNFVPGQGCDRFIWTISPSRLFTVKSIYKILSEGGKIKSLLTPLWNARVMPSMKIFSLLLLKNRILTHDNMQRRHLAFTSGCVMCPDNLQHPLETALHLFFDCPFATQVWRSLSSMEGYQLIRTSDSVLHMFLTSMPLGKTRRRRWTTMFITATWLLWKERNNRTFRHKCATAPILVQRIVHETELCLRHC